MTAPILEARGLTMRFGGVVAVDNVDFILGDRELRCLIGPNGAGKSTFFKCLTGQYRPTAGRITYKGQDITGRRLHEIARLGIGIKTQITNVFNGLTVYENLWLALREPIGRAAVKARVEAVIERVGIAALAHRTVAHLAHGERQLVELALVLAGDPHLILLDEPAAGMTHLEAERTAGIIREINRTHALIVVEHDMQFVKQIADRVTVFHQGAILVEDKMENILRNALVRDVYLGKRVAA